jgi:hypothetical protein
VKSPGGIQVTRNHPPIAGKDREAITPRCIPGIWMAFGDLDGEDFWRNKGRVVHEGFVAEPSGGPGKGTFAVRNRYERASGELVCHEECRITIPRSARGIPAALGFDVLRKPRILLRRPGGNGLGLSGYHAYHR